MPMFVPHHLIRGRKEILSRGWATAFSAMLELLSCSAASFAFRIVLYTHFFI
jgi:hypothetical protein